MKCLNPECLKEFSKADIKYHQSSKEVVCIGCHNKIRKANRAKRKAHSEATYIATQSAYKIQKEERAAKKLAQITSLTDKVSKASEKLTGNSMTVHIDHVLDSMKLNRELGYE